MPEHRVAWHRNSGSCGQQLTGYRFGESFDLKSDTGLLLISSWTNPHYYLRPPYLVTKSQVLVGCCLGRAWMLIRCPPSAQPAPPGTRQTSQRQIVRAVVFSVTRTNYRLPVISHYRVHMNMGGVHCRAREQKPPRPSPNVLLVLRPSHGAP